jgi:DNA invertase Pin-like site-specific DNA recombinase
VAAGKIDNLTFASKGVIGEQQRARIAYTTHRGLKARAARGGVTGGETLGYMIEDMRLDAAGRPVDRLAIDEKNAAPVRRMFELHADGHNL